MVEYHIMSRSLNEKEAKAVLRVLNEKYPDEFMLMTIEDYEPEATG